MKRIISMFFITLMLLVTLIALYGVIALTGIYSGFYTIGYSGSHTLHAFEHTSIAEKMYWIARQFIVLFGVYSLLYKSKTALYVFGFLFVTALVETIYSPLFNIGMSGLDLIFWIAGPLTWLLLFCRAYLDKSKFY